MNQALFDPLGVPFALTYLPRIVDARFDKAMRLRQLFACYRRVGSVGRIENIRGAKQASAFGRTNMVACSYFALTILQHDIYILWCRRRLHADDTLRRIF